MRCGGLPEGDEPSALRWMAAGAEFLCGVLGDGVASALRWMWVGECGIGGVVDAVGIGGFCRRVFVDF